MLFLIELVVRVSGQYSDFYCIFKTDVVCFNHFSPEAISEAEAHFTANKISVEFKNSGKTTLNVHWHVISADKCKSYFLH